jgi:hypothetical protein
MPTVPGPAHIDLKQRSFEKIDGRSRVRRAGQGCGGPRRRPAPKFACSISASLYRISFVDHLRRQTNGHIADLGLIGRPPLAHGLRVSPAGVDHYLCGMPTQVVVPSVSRAAVLHGLAGTIFVDVPSAEGLARPVDELTGCSATP